MGTPEFTMRQLLEAGVHFGHQKHRWNPKMTEYIYGVRNNIHIIDLAQTVPMLHRALQAAIDVVGGGGRVLFVGTKRQASEPIAAAATRSAQYYVNSRWLGGMLTNWRTISNSISRLRELQELLEGGGQGLIKKERLSLTRERNRLENALGGIKDMGGVPDLVFVIDTNKEAIAVAEAKRLNIPVAAILDSNSNPDGITYPIPGNDDAGRSISLYCDLFAKAAIEGISRGQGAAGVDIGAAETPAAETAVEPTVLEAVEPMPEATAVSVETPPEPAPEAPEKPAAEAPVDATPEPAAKAPAEAMPAPVAEAPVEATPEPAAEAPAEAEEAMPEPAGEAPSEGEATAEVMFQRPEGDPDDLKKIPGIGKVLEGRLNTLGVTQFAQLATMSTDEIAGLDEAANAKGRIERDDWVGQAKLLAEG